MSNKSKNSLPIGWIVFGLLAVGFVVWITTLPRVADGELLSKNGIHYHPHLTITIKGENIPIPKDIGIGAVHNPIHTHDPDGIVHLEFEGVVKKEDTNLGKFFEVWDKDFSKDSIMGNKTGEGGTVKMKVNGAENAEFENYLMKDGDKIEVIYE
jgi:hypothetical protein